MAFWFQYYFFNAHYPTRIAAWTATSLLLISITLIIVVFVSRKLSQKKHARVARLTDKYETLLTNILFEDVYDADTKGFDRIIKSIEAGGMDKLKHAALVKVILKTKENLIGDTDNVLSKFYRELNLKKYALKQLKTGQWQDQAFVLQELGKMDVKEALPSVKKFTNNSNPILRNVAQYAVIDLEGDEALDFLTDLDYPLSRWQQIRIIEELEKHATIDLPSFYYLLEVENLSVVEFGLRMIAHFNQVEESDKLAPFFKHNNQNILITLANTVKTLELQEMVPIMLREFPSYTADVKVAMIRAIGEIGNQEEHLRFLFTMLNVKEYRVALAAARSICQLTKWKLSADLLNQAGSRVLFLKHVLDERKL